MFVGACVCGRPLCASEWALPEVFCSNCTFVADSYIALRQILRGKGFKCKGKRK